MMVGIVQRVDISSAYIIQGLQVGASPREARAALSHDQRIGCEPRPAPVSIGEGMHEHKPVMKPHRDFIRGVGAIVDPVARVVEYLLEFGSNP